MVWITRIDFAGFGNLSGEKIEFEERKLNLVLESDSVGKITVYGALWATLFNFQQVKKVNQTDVTDRDRFAPVAGSGLPYISGTDLFVGPRYLKVIRDFTEDAVQLVDMSKSNADVTGEFFTAEGTDQVGLKITGMSREIFRCLSIVTSTEMAESRVGRLSDLARAMKEMLAGRPFKLGSEQALAAIDDALTFFPHQGKKLRGATVVRDLEGRYYELSDKVNKMEQERKRRGLSLETTNALPTNFSGDDQGKLSEYFELCMECTDIDSRLVNAEETLVRVQELRSELERMGSMDYFPVDLQKQTEELFTRRQSRQQDLDSLVTEYAGKIKEFDEKQKQLAVQYIGLDVYSEPDAQAISTLAKEYQQVNQDLSDFRQKKRNEIERLKNMGLDLAALEEMRKILQGMPTQDYEDARSFDAQLVTAAKRITECEETFARQRTQLVEIDRERKDKADTNKKYCLIGGILLLVFILGTGAAFAFLHPINRIVVVALIVLDALSLFVTGAFAVLFMRPKYYKDKLYKAAQQDMNAQTRALNDLNQNVSTLEVKLDALAHKVKFGDGKEFLAKLRDYTAKIPALRELDYMEQTIAARDSSLSQLKYGVEPYFARAGRMTLEIRPDTTSQLAEEIKGYVVEAKELASVYGPITAAKEQMEFLTSEITEIQKQLLANFIKARMEHLHDYNESSREFFAKVAQYQQWQSMKLELNRLENDMSSGFVPDELPPQIERLEKARREKASSMQELVNRCPNILELAPRAKSLLNAMVNYSAFSNKAPAVVTRRSIENLKAERDGLTALVRAANSSDASYVLMLQEIKAVQSELTIVRRVKTALEHARDRVVQAQSGGGVDWQLKLTEIMEDMLTEMGIEAPNYESALCDTTGGVDPAQSGPLIGKPFSLLTMEQVRWFARVVVSRVLALNHSFPLVLNEPFGMGAEPLRENNLPFIFSLLDQGFQVLALTSEATRFEAAYSAATNDQKKSLHTCARVSLGS